MEKKKISLCLFIFIFITYLELMFRALTVENFFSFSLLYILASIFFFGTILNLLCHLFKEKVNKIIFFILFFIFSFWVSAEVVYKYTFNLYFSLSLFKLADQIITFWQDALKMIGKNILYILIMMLPFISSFFISKRLEFKPYTRKKMGLLLIIIVVQFFIFRGFLLLNKNKSYSAYDLYYKVNDASLNMEKFGVNLATFIDLKRTIFGFEETLSIQKIKKTGTEEEPKYAYNIDKSLDFPNLITTTTDSTLKTMHEYFANETGTLQNYYTGLYKGKNLILIMAESFNSIAVSPELTPTLYKLVNSSFTFENFYTPINNSTIGGEFQELTGLFAVNSILKTWRNGKNYFPYGVGNVFTNLNYSTYAYHNHNYTFQDRNKYLKALGFNNFLGCHNGLEKKINCKIWPESDIEMINATVDDYLNQDHFMVFYATVSGHGNYNWVNSMAKKHQAEVNSLPYSEPVKAYLAAQIELDDALEILLTKLEAAGKLQDTVIALVGDHYPYMLSVDQVNELSSFKRDSVIEINRSNFILYNSETKNVEITKVGSEIDVIPTLYNLFGIDYDSRLFIGKDILSTEPGLAIFNNRSWVSDQGKYYANTQTFVANKNTKIADDYVDNMNQIVSNKINMSKYIIEKNYYKVVLGE